MFSSLIAKLYQKLKWHHVYYVLALIDIATILAALSLTQSLMTTYEQSVEENKVMSASFSEIIKLGYIAQAVNEPGNRVFESRDVSAESISLEQNKMWFDIALTHTKTNLALSFTAEQLNKIEHDLDTLDAAMATMVAYSANIFSAFEQGQEQQAASYMSLMDNQFYTITQLLGETSQYISDIQNDYFEKQVKKAQEIKRYEIAIFVVVLIIITLVTLYGHRLGSILKAKEQELNAALIDAQTSAKAKEMFLANMSHEIRTPMNATLSMLKLIDFQSLSDADKQHLKLALTSAENLLVIINDILNLSKIENDCLELEQVNFNLKAVLTDQVQLFRTSQDNTQVKLTTNFDDITISWLNGDYNRLIQVLNNLLNNAYKFTTQGEISVIATTQSIGDKVKATIVVNDTGIGIEQEKLASIFDPFSQADASTTRKFGGTGLGLAISKQISQLMKGDLTVTSQVGRGSSFTFTAMFSQGGEQKAEQVSKLTMPVDQEIGFSPLAMHLLVAEDNRVNQIVIKQVLSKMGCTCDVAQNGQEVIEKLSDEHDAVLMDCLMPVMDGFEATQAIRQLTNGLQNVAIIALTANSLEGDKEKCLDIGMDNYLSKPIVFEQLYEVLYQIKMGEKCAIPVTLLR